MSPWYDTEFVMMGLDCDEDVKYYSSPTPAKRKRDNRHENMTVMKGFESPVDGATGSQDEAAGIYAGNGHVDGQVNEHHGYVPPFGLWSTNAFAEPCDPYGNWFLNNYSFNDQPAGTATPLIESPTGPINADYDLHGMTAEAAQANVDAGVADVDAPVKAEPEEEQEVSLTPLGGSEYDESEYDERRPSKIPKLNKDGIPRKPRQPRPKLLKWDDNDWKNVALGLVWACGENGIQIPFDQASQIVSESCTAGALQQALLKLRGKQIAEGFQIPSLRMAWTRKNKNSTSSKSSADLKPLQDGNGTHKLTTPKRKPTRFAGNQSLLITLKRAYKDTDRCHLASPYVPTIATTGDGQTARQTSRPPSLTSLNGNAAANMAPMFPGWFALGTPPTTPSNRTTWDPVLANPNLTPHGDYTPQYALAGRAPGIAGPNSPSFNTTGSVFLPASPTTEKDIKRHRRGMTIVESDFNFVYRQPPPKYCATTQATTQGRAKPNRGSKTRQGKNAHKKAAADVFNASAVTKEDVEHNFVMQFEDDSNNDKTCGGSKFHSSYDPSGGPGGASGSNGLAV
jgi:hypothetical protein